MTGMKDIRNVALVGHDGAGKTSLAEALLFRKKATGRLGSVASGQSNLDYDPDEVNRYTINLSTAPVEHNGKRINFIDTPGYADFIGDAVAGMYAAEIALFVVDAISGPQVLTDRLWNIAEEMEIPRAIIINQLDKERADFNATFETLREKYGDTLVPVQIPIGKEEDFHGVVNIIRMEAYMSKDGVKAERTEIPTDLATQVEAAREALCDRTVEADEELMMQFLEGERIGQEDLERLLALAIAGRKVIPVFVGSATNLVGISGLLDEIAAFFPYPSKHAPIELAGDKEGFAEFDQFDEFTGQVFKTLSDPYVGRLSFVKIFSGSITPGAEFVNSRTGKKERAPHLLRMIGKENVPIEGTVVAGDVIVIPKLNDTMTNDTLSTSGDITYADMPLPSPQYPVAIAAKTKADEDKLGSVLKSVVDEDPSLVMRRDEETRQTVINALGDTAIDVLLNKLKTRYNVEAELLPLRIPYRETVRKIAEAQGRHKKQSGGSGQFADCWLRLEPNPNGGYEFLDEIVGGRIPRQFIPAVDKGIQETMEGGVIAGYPFVDVKAAVYDGSYHSVDSNEMAFRTAARIGFKAAAEAANPVILEPMAELEITVPEEYTGAVMGDLPTLRGRVMGMDAAAPGWQTIKAIAPYAEVVNYTIHLRSLSQGTGNYTLKLEGYEQVPADLQEKIVSASKEEE
ncbi:MAG: elongation factor G [Coriobacteriia bacterium]|nr:elongation factor G [Coriobacteriia bacterium]MCL2745780.1 elongation factor G [Coriobacteriia bacterium]MCL2870267.1 elongation factor G [Coriobacteriia bacterium]